MNGLRSGLVLLVCLASCGETQAPPPASPPVPSRPAPAERDAKPPIAESPPPTTPSRAAEGEHPPATSAKKKEPADTKGRAKSPELFKRYMVLMESNGELMESIQADLDAKRYESAVKPKVVRIRKNAEAARELHYRKDADQDTALTNDFDLFLLKMKGIEESPWTEDTSSKLLENLSGRCLTCHDTFQ
jgi:hypothetical protein